MVYSCVPPPCPQPPQWGWGSPPCACGGSGSCSCGQVGMPSMLAMKQLLCTGSTPGTVPGAGVASFNSRTGAVILTLSDLVAAGGCPVNSPALTGTPSAPTAAPGTNTTQLATTAFVEAAIAALTSGTPGGAILTGPIKGVTDGSAAAAGNVGEFVYGNVSTTWNVPALTSQNQTVAALTLQPGDWSVSFQLQMLMTFSGASIQANPVPAGMTPTLAADIFGGPLASTAVNSNTCRVLISTATQLSFQIAILAGSVAANGSTFLVVVARRVR